MTDDEFFENVRSRVLSSKEKLDPEDFDYMFTDDVTMEEADRYYEILDKRKAKICDICELENGAHSFSCPNAILEEQMPSLQRPR